MEAPVPSRIARLLEHSSPAPNSPARRCTTRSQTIARKAFILHDSITGEAEFIPLGQDYVEEMRGKSIWMRSRNNLRDEDTLVEIDKNQEYILQAQGYEDPDMDMDEGPMEDLSALAGSSTAGSRSEGSWASQWRADSQPGDEDHEMAMQWANKWHMFNKWHREHFSPEDDVNCEEPTSVSGWT